MDNMMRSKTRIRRGLTLIEVLSAIAVATIGVFGVLVLVPMASRLSQIGFSNEAARSNSANTLAKAKSFGALDYTRWIYYDEGTGNVPVPLTATTTPPGPFADVPPARMRAPFLENTLARPTNAFCIDPMLLAPERGLLSERTNRFPMVSLEPYLGTLEMPRVSVNRIRNVTPLPMGSGIASEFMSEANTLRLSDAVTDLSPPMQKFLDEPGVGRMTRELSSSKSSVLLLLPTDGINSLVYRAMSITIDGRAYTTNLVGVNSFDRVFTVDDGSGTVRTDFGTMDLRFNEYDFDPAVTADNLPSGGWVILVSANSAGGAIWSTAKAYQIISSDPINAHQFDVTVVGPNYVAPDVDNGAGGIAPAPTHAIYVQGAVDVHEMEVRLGIE